MPFCHISCVITAWNCMESIVIYKSYIQLTLDIHWRWFVAYCSWWLVVHTKRKRVRRIVLWLLLSAVTFRSTCASSVRTVIPFIGDRFTQFGIEFDVCICIFCRKHTWNVYSVRNGNLDDINVAIFFRNLKIFRQFKTPNFNQMQGVALISNSIIKIWMKKKKCNYANRMAVVWNHFRNGIRSIIEILYRIQSQITTHYAFENG